MVGPSSNLRTIGNKNIRPRYALTAQGQTPHKVNSVTHQISGVAQEYRHIIKVQEKHGIHGWGEELRNMVFRYGGGEFHNPGISTANSNVEDKIK